MRCLFAVLLSVLTAVRAADSNGLLSDSMAASRQGDSSKAIELVTKAISTDPKSSDSYFFRAKLYSEISDHKAAIADLEKVIALVPSSISAYQQRGSEQFKLGRIAESISSFDKVLDLSPSQAPYHWQRGISLYYAGRYEDGRKQFELHQTVNPQDVENAVWHFLCVARLSGLDEARKHFIPIQSDLRIPLMQVHALFAGKGSEEAVLKAALDNTAPRSQLNERLFYAHLYLGLYDDVAGKTAEAIGHLRKAAKDYYQDNYMGDVARVHLQILEMKK